MEGNTKTKGVVKEAKRPAQTVREIFRNAALSSTCPCEQIPRCAFVYAIWARYVLFKLHQMQKIDESAEAMLIEK